MAAFDQQDELVAAQARHRVRGTHAFQQALRHPLQQQVSHCVAECVVHLLEAVQVHKQQRQQGLVALRPGQRGFQAVEKQLAVGQVRKLVVLRHLLQSIAHLGALYGGRHLGRDELQQLFVPMRVTRLLRVALQHQCAHHARLGVQRHTQPVKRPGGSCHVRRRGGQGVGGEQQRLPVADDVRAQGICIQWAGCGGRMALVHVVRKADRVGQVVVQRHREIGGRQQRADGLVDVRKQRDQVFRRLSGLGDGIDGCLQRFSVLALGDVVCHRQAYLLVVDPARRPADMGDLPILAHIAVLEMQLELAFGHAFCLALGGGAIFRVHHVQHAPANDLFGGIAKDSLECRTDIHDGTVGLDDAHGVEEQVHDVRGGKGLHRRDKKFRQTG